MNEPVHGLRIAPSGRNTKIVVVGAGLAGPVAAMYLARRHSEVTVVERHQDPRLLGGGRGRSLMVILSHRGWRVLRELGLERDVRAICAPLSGRCGHLPGGESTVTPYSRGGAPIWAVERDRLHRMLLDAAQALPGVRILFERPVLQVDLDAPALLVGEGSGPDARERWIRCEHILGCDGVHSAVRSALVRRGATEQISTLELGYQEIDLALPDCDRGLMHYWPAGDAMFGAFPRTSSDLYTGSVFFRREGPAPSYASVNGAEALGRQFADAFPGLAETIPDLEHQLASKPVSSILLTGCDRWVWQDKAVLVGDACHAMAPFMGQGMNTAFEDVRTLVECLDRGGRDWSGAFAEFERIRKPDAEAITEISYQHYRTMSRVPDLGHETEEAVVNRLTGLFPTDFVPLYERCAFSDESFSRAAAADRRLRTLARMIIERHGHEACHFADHVLRACVVSVHGVERQGAR